MCWSLVLTSFIKRISLKRKLEFLTNCAAFWRVEHLSSTSWTLIPPQSESSHALSMLSADPLDHVASGWVVPHNLDWNNTSHVLVFFYIDDRKLFFFCVYIYIYRNKKTMGWTMDPQRRIWELRRLRLKWPELVFSSLHSHVSSSSSLFRNVFSLTFHL